MRLLRWSEMKLLVSVRWMLYTYRKAMVMVMVLVLRIQLGSGILIFSGSRGHPFWSRSLSCPPPSPRPWSLHHPAHRIKT